MLAFHIQSVPDATTAQKMTVGGERLNGIHFFANYHLELSHFNVQLKGSGYVLRTKLGVKLIKPTYIFSFNPCTPYKK